MSGNTGNAPALLIAIILLSAGACARHEISPIAGGRFESSGVIDIAGQNGVLFVDDNDALNAYWLPLTSDGKQQAPAHRVPLGVTLTDPEAMTSDGRFIYIVGSQSKPGSPEGVGLIRFVFNAASGSAEAVEAVSGLKQLIASAIPALEAFDTSTGDDNFNIEGLAWDAKGARLLIGLRAPIINGQAFVVSARLRDDKAGLTAANLELSEAARLSLNGSGIRSIEFDGPRDQFLVVSGASANEETDDFKLIEWDGGNVLKEVAKYPPELKPEGITRIVLSERAPLFLVFDVGRYQLLK